jgi:non-specific serine/threonine protein kinase
LADPALVLPTIAPILGLREMPGESLKDLVTRYLHAKHLLLLLDNCEHLVEACARLADHLLHNCHHLKIIASSREALGIMGETVYRVPPLALPDSDDFTEEAVRRSEAAQLFLDRAAAVKPRFALSEHNISAVVQICQRLDGIPLALELAAARVGMLTPEQIAARLDDRFRLLTGGSRTALPRQQTLRSLIDWSYELLAGPERLLFCQLAVFVGGWSLEAAEAVCPDLDVFALLAQLVLKSLVVAEEHEGDKATRFRLLETIRQYARDRLLEMGSAAQVRDRHMAHYLQFAEAGEGNFFGPQRLTWVDQCELEHDNFRAALQWGLEHDVDAALRLGGSLAGFWSARGFTMEGRRWLRAVLERAAALREPEGEPGRLRQAAQAKAFIGDSIMSYGEGDFQAGLNAGQDAARLYRQLGDRFGLGMALFNMGNMAALQGDFALAERVLTEAVGIGREIGEREISGQVILAFALGVLGGFVYLPRGDIDAARASAEESVRISREIALPWLEAQGEMILGRIASLMGHWDEARGHTMKAVAIFTEMRDPMMVN